MKVKALTPSERMLIERVIEFAKLESIESTAQVESLFMLAAKALGAKNFKVLPVGKHAAYTDDQRVLREWIERMLKPRRKAREKLELAREVIEWTNKADSRVVASIEDGIPRWIPFIEFSGIQALIGYALWILIDEDSGRLQLLGRCAKCHVLFLRSRKDTKFHDPREGNVIRATRSRKKRTNASSLGKQFEGK